MYKNMISLSIFFASGGEIMEWKTGVIVVEGPHLVTEHKLTDRVLIASGTGQQMTFNLKQGYSNRNNL
jgi:hypothetical protein